MDEVSPHSGFQQGGQSEGAKRPSEGGGVWEGTGVARIFQQGGGGQIEGAKRPGGGRVWEGVSR